MLSKSGVERIAGIIFFLLVVSLVVTVSTEIEIDTDVADFRDSLREIADDREQHRVSVAFDILANLLAVAIAGAIYMVFRLHERSLALLSAFGFLAGGVTFMVIGMTSFALDFMAREFVGATGLQADTIATSARGIALVGELSRDIGVTFLGQGMLFLGILIAWRGAILRPLGWLAALAGVLFVLHWLRLVNDDLIWIARAGLIATLVFFLITSMWLLLRGTKEVPVSSESAR